MAKSTKPGSIVASTKTTLDLIERENARLNAFVTITRDTAMAEAALADARVASGDTARPLNGMAIGVKDIIDVAGVVSGCGSLTTRGNPPAAADAPVVERLRAAGAVIPGKTHTVEYAFGGYGTNVTVGTPWNPWDRKVHRIPGGSSSGSGVAVGAGLVPAALGTDTGGSVRIPAALCGCVGLKTSLGRVSRAGVAPLSQTLDSIGPLAADVTTAARLFAAMQGQDAADPTTAGIAPVNPFPDLEKGVKGLRLGRLADADLPLASAETRADFAGALKLLSDLGARIETVEMPESIESLGAKCGRIIAPEGHANWRAHVENEASGLAPPIRARMLAGRKTSSGNYIAIIDEHRRAAAGADRLFDRMDAILLPTIPFPAMPVAEVDETIAPMAAHTRWVNFLCLAALAVPTRLSKAGLPMSLQIVVRRFDDSLALRIGRAFETARGAFPKPTKE